jgi:hypothetical protein
MLPSHFKYMHKIYEMYILCILLGPLTYIDEPLKYDFFLGSCHVHHLHYEMPRSNLCVGHMSLELSQPFTL